MKPRTPSPEDAIRRFTLDPNLAPYMGLSVFAHLAFVTLAMTMPGDANALELDYLDAANRYAQHTLTPDQQEPPVVELAEGPSMPSQESAAHAGEEGSAGKPEVAPADKRLAVSGAQPDEDIEIKRRRDIAVASNAGLAADFRFASEWGDSERSIGADAEDAIGNLQGREPGESGGFGGLGITSAGRGGGGQIEGSLGVDLRSRTKGRTSGRNARADLCCKKEHQVAVIVPQRPKVTGALDREIIRSVVRRNRRALKACYESELQKNRQLSGQLVVKFIIDAGGRVIVAKTEESELANPTVESCVNRRVKRFAFPASDGAGIVIVKYPFNFRPA